MTRNGRRPRNGTRTPRPRRRGGSGGGIIAAAFSLAIGGGIVYYAVGCAGPRPAGNGRSGGGPKKAALSGRRAASPADASATTGGATAAKGAAPPTEVAKKTPAPKLIEGGTAVGEIIIPTDASKDVEFAAGDLRNWLEKMTGASVPVQKAPSKNENTKVYVGKAFADAYADDLAKLAGTDGFAIRRNGTDVYVFGDRPRGTAYGVFSLLERNTDLIWPRPNVDFEAVYGTHEDIVLSDTNVLDMPVFLHRAVGDGHPPSMASANWLMRNRINRVGRRQFNGPGWDMQFAIGNNLYYELKPQFKEHPEWFGYDPLNDRRVCGAGEGTVCLTHPDLPAIWARAIARRIRKEEAKCGRKIETYTIGPGDNWFCCCCPECVKPITLPDGSKLKMKHPDSTKDPLFRSTQFYMFLNRAMETWQKEIPHVKPVSLAYIYLAEPPAVDIHPKLWIFFAPYPTNSMRWPLLDPRQSRVWRERFRKWQKKTKNLGFYEYYFSKPSPQAFYAQANLKALLGTGDPKNSFIYTEYTNDRGTRGIGEGMYGWDVGAMNTWVIMRLFWDPTQDADELYRYYFTRTYRDAAPAMLKYYKLIRTSWLDPNTKANDSCHAGLSGVYDGMVVKPGLEPQVKKFLAEAEAAATHPVSKTLVKRMRSRLAAYTKGMARMVVQHIEEMSFDGATFASVQWEKPEPLDDFRVTSRRGKADEMTANTIIKAGHDKKNLYLRFTAVDPKVGAVKTGPSGDGEIWPKGDHGEIWFSPNWSTHYVFAFDSTGNVYDAKSLDRTWDSGWSVKTQRTGAGWEAIAVIPLKALGLKPGAKTGLKWFATRTVDHGDGAAEQRSYQGLPLYNKFFPIVME